MSATEGGAALPATITVDLQGGTIVARVTGEPTPGLLSQAQHRVLAIVRDTGTARVLYDCREMLPPPVDVPLAQRALDATLQVGLRRAVVVPSTRLAYLARLAFGDGNYRVFYDDMAGAVTWLGESS